MKTLDIKITQQYKLYKENTPYCLEGDLIILSGINGSGKSQLLKIISKSTNEIIGRTVTQTDNDGVQTPLEEVLLLSFRDNIDIGNDFGHFSVTYLEQSADAAWNFYKNNILNLNDFRDDKKRRRFESGSLIFNDKGMRDASWRSITKLVQLIKNNYSGDKVYHLTKADIESVLPADFIWRNENDIIAQIGNLFYIACCNRVTKQVECSKTTKIFDNSEWLKFAPWTVLNRLFEDLGFKYRFKSDYEFKMPNMDENPKLRDNADIRNLTDLSDGEKAILKLALIALDEEISKDIKLVLFDEYDAPLNPSLTEAFYHVIEKFYVEKGIQVIITTHSPATISMAPEYARFYEVFPQENASPKIVQVSQFDYSELRLANKQFYDRIRDQSERIKELERITAVANGHSLFVEDKYDQIYKIAYLKTKGVNDITEENFEVKFNKLSPFSIHGNFSCGGLCSYLTCQNITHDQNSSTICLFDFDAEGFRKFEDLEAKKDNSGKLFLNRDGSISEGLYLKHKHTNRYALMLPIPNRLKIYVSEKTSSDCFIEIETLLSEEYLKSNPKAEKRSEALAFYKMRDKQKCVFWKDLFAVDSVHFNDFKPLFDRVETLLGVKS